LLRRTGLRFDAAQPDHQAEADHQPATVTIKVVTIALRMLVSVVAMAPALCFMLKALSASIDSVTASRHFDPFPINRVSAACCPIEQTLGFKESGCRYRPFVGAHKLGLNPRHPFRCSPSNSVPANRSRMTRRQRSRLRRDAREYTQAPPPISRHAPLDRAESLPHSRRGPEPCSNRI
ncbi:MAG: hypothetical protein RR758_02610, partial [Burkholderiaceae bacterium]